MTSAVQRMRQTAAAMQHQMPSCATDHFGGQLGKLQLQRTQGMIRITEGAGLQRGGCSDQR